MNRLICLLLILPLFYAAHSQRSSKHPISIGFNFSPDYSSRILYSDGGSPVIKIRNKTEIGKIGFTTGANICMTLNDRIGVEMGIQYSNKGYKSKMIEFTGQQPDPAMPVKGRFVYNYRYVDIPIKINFTAGKKKTHFLGSVGFATNILLKGEQSNIYVFANGEETKQTIHSTVDLKKIGISPLVSLGIEHQFNKNMSLRVEPTFRYGIISTYDAPLEEHLWSAGLNIGLYYRLK